MPIHLYWGDDEASRGRAVEELVESTLDPTWAAMNLTRLDGQDGEQARRALEEARTPPLGAGGRVIVLQRSPFCGTCPPALAEALEACLGGQAQSGALLMHAYDQPEVVAGAGTLGVEIESEAGLPDRVLVSVGGGGLVAGLAAWFDGRCRIEALEPANAPTLHAARVAGRPVDVAVSGVAADSLGARRIGDIAWKLQALVHSAHLLDDDAIERARLRMWRELRLAVEPAAALPLAALWEGVVRPAPAERLALIVCGANTDPSSFAD